MKQFSDETQEAFRLTSDSIGKEWRHLYHQLPFDPPRDIQQRERDLEGKQRSQHSLVQEIILNTHKAFCITFYNHRRFCIPCMESTIVSY